MGSEGGVAVIGANGFLGGALATAFARTSTPVATFTRSTPFLRPDGRLADAARGASTVYWLASSVRPATADSGGDRIAADRNALLRLLDALAGDAGHAVPRVVAVSSGGTVYDSTAPSPHGEGTPLRPANAYGAAMVQIESTVRSFSPSSLVLRVANAYGPGQVARNGQGVIAYWLSAIAAGAPIHVMGNPAVTRDYVYIDDVVGALMALHGAGDLPDAINIGSGRPTSLQELADLVIATVAPQQVDVVHDPGRGFDAPSTWLDVTLAAEHLRWRPAVDLATGLRRTWESVRAGAGRVAAR